MPHIERLAECDCIYGKVRGDVTCRGVITIFKNGVLAGDARADQVDFKGDGMVSGEITLEQEIDVSIPIKSGYNPSIIN